MRKIFLYSLIALALVAAVAGTAYYLARRVAVAPPVVTKPPEKVQPTLPPTAGDTCVECHRGEIAFVGHTFADWEGSSHAKSGVSCQHCHGGDPSQTTAELAHRGVRPSRDPQSRLYFTQIPQTCGLCHSAELGLFKRSVHFLKLQQTGQGPNCITCHGAMATVILKPIELAATCNACHNPRLGILPDEPLKARFVLALMLQAQEQFRLTKKLIELRRPQIDVAQAEALLARAQEAIKFAEQEWHTFRVELVEARLEKALELVRQAEGKLDVEE